MEQPHRVTGETQPQQSTELFVGPISTPKQKLITFDDIMNLLFGGDIKVKYTIKIDNNE
jgi:hypothetical protein